MQIMNLKKYLSLVKEAYKEKKMLVNAYASYIDKMLMEVHKFHKYGTQLIKYNGQTVYYPINIDSLELYRKTLITNLDTSNILSMFTNMNISKSEYKKILPKLIYLYQNETTQ